MKRIMTFIAIFTTGLVLTACGDTDRPKPPKHHPNWGEIAPAPTPAIHLKASDGSNTFNLTIECGAETSLKQCAEVNQSIIEKVSTVRSGRAGQGG